MPNSNYIKGVKKERKIVNDARAEGLLSFRSAGSHSPVDVVIIDAQKKEIELIQCKPESLGEKQKSLLYEALKYVEGVYVVSFKVK